MSKLRIKQGDNLAVLAKLRTGKYHLIYIDPPFNTGKTQKRTRIKTKQSKNGSRSGFGGKAYTVLEATNGTGYNDSYTDFLSFLQPRLEEAYRVLHKHGSFFLHIDYREAHYCKVLLDSIFGRSCFMNEIIWAYDFGGRSRKKWPAKHDTIFWYVKDPKHYTFNYEDMERIPYMAPGLAGKEKAARGKTPTDVWWHTIVPTNGKEKTGYPTQKPLGILRRIISVHSNPNDWVLDFFAGSGTTGEAALELGRNVVLVDSNPEAIKTMKKRLKKWRHQH